MLYMREYPSRQEIEEIVMTYIDEYERQTVVRRAPSPGIAAVLSVLLPGLGQVYNGRLLAGAIWFAATGVAYWAILVPGFIVHAFCIWSAYRDARDWRSY